MPLFKWVLNKKGEKEKKKYRELLLNVKFPYCGIEEARRDPRSL